MDLLPTQGERGTREPTLTGAPVHLTSFQLYVFIALALEVVMTIIAFALSVSLSVSQETGPLYARVGFTFFALAVSQVAWAYIFLFSMHLDDQFLRKRIWLIVGALCLIFIFSAAAAMSAGLSNGEFCSKDASGVTSRCRTAQACVTFLWIGITLSEESLRYLSLCDEFDTRGAEMVS